MKKLLSLLVVSFSFLVSSAQIAHWAVSPIYDVIQATDGQSMVIADSANTSILMTIDGKVIAKSSDALHIVSDDIAVTTKPSTTTIKGFYTVSGTFKPLEGYRVAHNYPRYSEGNLLVRQGEDYVYLDVEGNIVGAAAIAHPFFHGLAACLKYPSPDKRKSPTWCLIAGDMQPAPIQLKGKAVPAGNIDFISSVNGEGKCLVILKGLLYLYNDSDWNLTPIAPQGESTPAKLTGNIKDLITPTTSGPLTLRAKAKNGDVTVQLDKQFILQSIQCGNERQTYPISSPYSDPTSRLSIFEAGGKKGIAFNDTLILAPQFESVNLCANNHAAVTLNGKSGIIYINPNEHFEFEFNNDQALAFRHQHLQTTLRLDAPSTVSMERATLQSTPDGTCRIDLPSKRAKDTSFGNALLYRCTLTIPEGLPDDITDVTFPVQVNYDGLTSAPIPCAAQAWHYKYFTITVDESKSIIADGNLTFTFHIKAERRPGEPDVPHTVNVHSFGHKATVDKVSESYYRCQVFNLDEGKNTVTVQVTETGCPPSSYPFEVTYSKAKEQSQKAAARRPIRIENKTKANPVPKQPTPTPAKKQRPVLEI